MCSVPPFRACQSRADFLALQTELCQYKYVRNYMQYMWDCKLAWRTHAFEAVMNMQSSSAHFTLQA